MPAKLFHATTGVADNASINEVLQSIMQEQARGYVTATVLTDSSTGTASTTRAVPGTVAAVAVANTGSNLANGPATDAALVTVQTALATLFAKANTANAALDHPVTFTYSGGGVSGGNTLAAMTKTVAGATTGALGTNWNAARVAIDRGFQALVSLTNNLCGATGQAKLSSAPGVAHATTVAAITPTTGTPASPGVLKADVDAALTIWANNAATIAARLNAVVTAANNKPSVVALG